MTQAEAVRKSECVACGDWVLRCAHFDGRWVILHGIRYEHFTRWYVCFGTGVGPGGEGEHIASGAPNIGYYDDEAAALAAFHEAEEKLLRGDL